MTMRTRARARIVALCLATALAGGAVTPAYAQSAPVATPPPVRQIVDRNGVDLATGNFTYTIGTIATGGEAGEALEYAKSWIGSPLRDSFTARIIVSGGTTYVTFGGRSEQFGNSGGIYTSVQGSGSTLALSGSIYTYTTADGTVVRYSTAYGGNWPEQGIIAQVTDVTQPNGLKSTFHYYSAEWDDDGVGYESHRIQSITNNLGWQLKFTYSADQLSTASKRSRFNTVTSVTAINMAIDYCDPISASACTGLTQTWPQLTFSNSSTTITMTDNLSRQTRVTFDSFGRITGIKRPSSSSTDTTTITYNGSGQVATFNDGGGTWTYAYSLISGGTVRQTVVTSPLGDTETVTSDPTTGSPLSHTDGLGKTTTYQLDSKGRITRVTQPEGNYVEYTYDTRGNVTQVRVVAKPGSGLSDLTTSANYDTTCTYPVKCNKPNSVQDALGNQTDFTYDTTHGGLLSVTRPAATIGGIRPTSVYTYTTVYGRYKDNSGSIVQAPTPVYKLSTISTCATQSSCSGTSDEVKTSIDYGSGTGASNRQRQSVSTGAGDASLSAQTSYSYDFIGRPLTVDGPLPGTADTNRVRYDAAGQVVGTVGPDPDGGGSLKHRAVRISYNLDGLVTSAERGTVDSQSDLDWAAFSPIDQVDTQYDAVGRKTRDTFSSGGTNYQITSYSYDASSRPECTAIRLVLTSIPTSACTGGTPGAFGPDRITKVTYDAANQITKTQTAYGVSGEQADDVTATYTDNGQVETVTDAEGNKTTYEYDGFDRLSKTRYPSATKGAGTSSTTDYSQLIYDSNSNITSRRLRGYSADSAMHIDYNYDHLNRLTTKDLPGSEPDVTYSYDLLGRMTGASQSGNALTFGFDALGRNTSQGGPLGTVSYQYDLVGRRTRITWPDGFYVSYEYSVTGEMTVIRENGATSGVGVLGSYGYDNLGRRTTLTRGNGTVTTYSYDNASRLSSLALDLDGTTTTNDVTTRFTYSPAGGMASLTRDNDLYAWGGHYNVNRGYVSNGLNQLTTSGGGALTFDARGNLTGSGSDSFGYSSENLLISATVSGGASTYGYDPLLRLNSIEFGVSLGRRYQYDGMSQITSYSLSGVIMRRVVYGPGVDEQLVEYSGSGTSSRTFLHADERGSIAARSDSTGATVGVNTYDEYGIPGANNTGRFQYTGQEWIPQLGMSYYKARMYSPTLGRFMQSDPIGYGDGMNIYAYVGNDPVNSRDPSGLSDTELDFPEGIVVQGNGFVTGANSAPAAVSVAGVSGNTKGLGSRRIINVTSPKSKEDLPPFIHSEDCRYAAGVPGTVYVTPLKAGNGSFIPGAGGTVSKGTFEVRSDRGVVVFTGHYYTVGAGFGADTGISANLHASYRNMNLFIGNTWNVNISIGRVGISVNWPKDSLIPVGFSLAAGLSIGPGSATYSGTHIYGCQTVG